MRMLRVALAVCLTAALTLPLSASQATPAAKWDINAPTGPTTALEFDTNEGTWMNVDVSPVTVGGRSAASQPDRRSPLHVRIVHVPMGDYVAIAGRQADTMRGDAGSDCRRAGNRQKHPHAAARGSLSPWVVR